MKKILILGLGAVLSGGAASTCSAQGWVGKPMRASVCAYTPSKGSATRKQIADALRRSVGQQAGLYVIFVFGWIKVNGNWAFVQASPQSPDDENHYEPVSALLRRSKGLWSVVARADADDESSPAQAIRRVRRKFPSAPRDIFP